ncbi:DUF3093 domain-containing protein [Streptomyces caniferus]|nr:DUF3093 family protein [Streptomyces caniferus]
MRSHIPTAVRAENLDPDEPVPYVYISTRTPHRLAQALGPLN